MGGVARAPGYLASVPELEAFIGAGLAADPPTAGLGEETFALDAQHYLAEVALDVAHERWTADQAGDAAVPEELERHATYEVLAATAACAAQEATGRIAIDLALAADGARRVLDHVGAHGLGPLVRSYCTVAAFDDLQAISFYQPMPEREFVSGAWHRPWAAHSLRNELLMAAAAGLARIRLDEAGGRRLSVTAEGHRVLAEIRARLDAAGVLAERRQMLAVAHRNALALQHAGRGPAGDQPAAWAELLAAAGIREGGHVLLCGLAVGAGALVREVAGAVGPNGSVHVVDPAVAVVRRFAHDASHPLPPQVRLVPGRFHALPLSDAAVDACLAPGFLHLAADPRALAEIRRVLRPGGRLALAVPHAVDTGHALVREWLEPLLELAARLEVPEPVGLHAPGQAREALRQQGFVCVEARQQIVPVAPHPKGALAQLLHGEGAGAAFLERVPWRERHDLLRELGARAERLGAPAAAALLASGELVVAMAP